MIDHHLRLSTQDRHCVKVTCVYAVSEEKEKRRLKLMGMVKGCSPVVCEKAVQSHR